MVVVIGLSVAKHGTVVRNIGQNRSVCTNQGTAAEICKRLIQIQEAISDSAVCGNRDQIREHIGFVRIIGSRIHDASVIQQKQPMGGSRILCANHVYHLIPGNLQCLRQSIDIKIGIVHQFKLSVRIIETIISSVLVKATVFRQECDLFIDCIRLSVKGKRRQRFTVFIGCLIIPQRSLCVEENKSVTVGHTVRNLLKPLVLHGRTVGIKPHRTVNLLVVKTVTVPSGRPKMGNTVVNHRSLVV